MKYKVTNPKDYNVYVMGIEFEPGENEIKCAKNIAEILASTNDFKVEPVKKEKSKKKSK